MWFKHKIKHFTLDQGVNACFTALQHEKGDLCQDVVNKINFIIVAVEQEENVKQMRYNA